MSTLAICIATHERAHWLARSLEALSRQALLPDEIVINDSSLTNETSGLVDEFKQKHPSLPIKYYRSKQKALPWQRWRAFSNSTSELVFFIDDDVRLAPSACHLLVQAFVSDGRPQRPAGVGLILTMEDDTPYVRAASSWGERWLGTSNYPSGRITPGGLTVSHAGLPPNSTCPVQWLWGASMAYRREVLEKVGSLDGLFKLYEAGIGKAEDAVLSVQAGRHGELVLLTDRLAFHPSPGKAEHTANSHSGRLLGLRETIGRAHAMKWMAVDPRQARKDWARLVSRQLLLSGRQIATHPLKKTFWWHSLAVSYGIAWCLKNWTSITDNPRKNIDPKGFPLLAR